MSFSKQISVYNILNDIVEDTGLADVQMQHTWIRWVIKADRAVGAFHQYKIKSQKILVENCRVKLPCDLIALLPGMGITSNSDCGCDAMLEGDSYFSTERFSRFYGQSKPGTGMAFIMDAGGSETAFSLNYLYTGDGLQLFNSDYNGKYLYIRYLGYDMDCDGFPLIRETNSTACNYFVQYKMAEKSIWSRIGMKVDKSDTRHLMTMYGFHTRNARAIAGEPTSEERANIVNMINSPFNGIANAHFVYNDLYFQRAA